MLVQQKSNMIFSLVWKDKIEVSPKPASLRTLYPPGGTKERVFLLPSLWSEATVDIVARLKRNTIRYVTRNYGVKKL